MPLPDRLARLNRNVANPITRTFAGRVPGFAILVHRGRKSGQIYRTPLNAFGTDDGFVIALTYGPDRDWVKNVLAAGRCGLIVRGRRIGVTEPVIVEGDAGMALLPWLPKPILRLIKVDKFMRLRRV
jgi:deazaflavin-dependent oxidoreductase (nitroreductase family)